jgi:ribonuclease BN (tRNA processing enzyme)
MVELELTFLGTGNAFAPRGLCWNGFLLNGRHLFEAPPQALQSLNKMRIDPNEVETVVLSHQHGDHFLGLPFLLVHWQHMGRNKPVRIVAPLGTREAMLTVCELAYPDVTDASYGIEWIEAEEGRRVSAGPLEIEPVGVKHDPKLERCLGYHVAIEGRRLGYTGDSALCDGVLDLARQSEVLVSECASRDLQLPPHMNLLDDMPQVRHAMAETAELVLTHIGPKVDADGLPHTTVAEDFGRYRL